MSQIYKSAKGKSVDMARMVSQNELEVAVSNVKINARGDELGPGGQIIQKQHDIHEVVGTGIPTERKTTPVTAVQEETPAPKPQEKPQSALIQPAPSAVEPEKPNNKGKV